MKNNIFWKPERNKLEVVSFYLPFVSFKQTWTINGESRVITRFACNCIVNKTPMIANVCSKIAKDVETYAKNKALLPNAVVETSIFFNAPTNQRPMLFNYVISCYDSYPALIKFRWNLLKRISSIKEVKVGKT